MATFLKVVARLGKKAAEWAWANKGRVLEWIKNGAAIGWIVDKINDIVG